MTAENGTDDGSTYSPGTYTIISAAGGVTGTFTDLTDDYAFLDFTLGYGASEVTLNSSLTATSFCLGGMTANQCATGDGAFSLGSGDSVFDALLGLSAAQAPDALDHLSGEIHASLRAMLLDDSRFARQATMDRVRTALDGDDGVGGSGTEDGQRPGTGPIWGGSVGAWGKWDGDGNAAALDRRLGGIMMGGDGEPFDDARFGLMAGYSRSLVDVDERDSSATVDSYSLGAYGGARWNAFTLSGGLGFGWHEIETARSAVFSGFSDSLDASYSARTVQAWGEASYSLEAWGGRFDPFVNLSYVNLVTDGFTENGGAAALTVASGTVEAAFSHLGVRTRADLTIGDRTATLRTTIAWRHGFVGTPTTQMRFASGGDAFIIAGVPQAGDALVMGAELDMEIGSNATLGLGYEGLLGTGLQDHSARLDLKVRF